MAPTFAYDTTQVASPAITGTFPVGPATRTRRPACKPVGRRDAPAKRSSARHAVRSCSTRAPVLAGGFVNNTTTGPLVDGDRRMAYTWAFSAGVKHELTAEHGGVGRLRRQPRASDNTGVDRHQRRAGRPGERPGHAPRRRRVRPERRAGAARGAQHDLRPVQPGPDRSWIALDTDFDSLELGLDKRLSNQWSGRVSYTLAHCTTSAIIIVDSNPRLDYGRCDRDNVHAFATSANVDIWKGLGAGIVFRRYSGYPINETTGSDSNGDSTNNDRPKAGVDDLTPADPVGGGLEGRRRPQRHQRASTRRCWTDGCQYIWRIRRLSGRICSWRSTT